MKMKWFLVIGLVSLGVLCVCSAANAFSITDVKISGQSLPFHIGNAYSTTTIISRSAYLKNPTITFTVDWTDHGVVGTDGRDNSVPDPALRYYANIAVGSTGELVNSKDVWLGWETGNYKQAQTAFTMNDPWYGPYVKTSLKKGDWYVESIPLTPGKTTYTYTLQNPGVLCFDAHLYSIYIWAAGYAEPSQFYDTCPGPKWDYASGDNSDDSWNTVYGSYRLAQEFYVPTTFDFSYPELKLFRVGTIPAGASLTCSLYASDATNAWAPTGSPLKTFYSFNSTMLNFLPASPGYYTPFYSYGGTTTVRLTAGHSYVLVLSMTGGDSSNKIGWRKDAGWAGFPHYTKGLLSWCYSAGTNGGPWVRSGDTCMFVTEGYETTLSTSVGSIYFEAVIGGFNSRSFVFNTYGPSIDRSSAYDPINGWSGVSQYVYSTQNSAMTRISSLFLGNMNPPHLKLTAGDVINKGASFDTAAVSSGNSFSYTDIFTDRKMPVTVVLCDKNRNILDYSVVDSYLPILSTFPFKPYGPSVTIGTLTSIAQFRLLQYSVGAKKLEPRSSYYVYLGVPIGTYTQSNLYITTDDTMKKTNWSASSISIGGIVAPDLSKASDYMGAYVYFETQPVYTDKSSAGAFRTTPSWVTNLVIWCSNAPPDGLGMPWVAVLIGFMPALLLVGALYGFMRRWEISLPSFVYSLAASSGIYISWSVGLLALWIMVLVIASLVFISMFQFREPISQALQTAGVVKSSGALSSLAAKERRQEMLSSSGSTRRMLNSRRGRDQGVLPSKPPTFVGKRQITGENGSVDVTAWETPETEIINAERKKRLHFFRKKQGAR